MKAKKTGIGHETRRLALRKEILRNLDTQQLLAVVSGCPQCTITRTTGSC